MRMFAEVAQQPSSFAKAQCSQVGQDCMCKDQPPHWVGRLRVFTPFEPPAPHARLGEYDRLARPVGSFFSFPQRTRCAHGRPLGDKACTWRRLPMTISFNRSASSDVWRNLPACDEVEDGHNEALTESRVYTWSR